MTDYRLNDTTKEGLLLTGLGKTPDRFFFFKDVFHFTHCLEDDYNTIQGIFVSLHAHHVFRPLFQTVSDVFAED